MYIYGNHWRFSLLFGFMPLLVLRMYLCETPKQINPRKQVGWGKCLVIPQQDSVLVLQLNDKIFFQARATTFSPSESTTAPI